MREDAWASRRGITRGSQHGRIQRARTPVAVHRLRRTSRERRADLSSRLALDNPSLRPVPILLPFPRITPRRGSRITLRPSHSYRIAPTRRAAQALRARWDIPIGSRCRGRDRGVRGRCSCRNPSPAPRPCDARCRLRELCVERLRTGPTCRPKTQ